jgi:hypothetical protein
VLEPLSGADGRAAYIRIDGSTDPQDRHTLLGEFRRRRHLRVALVSVTAGGVGLDLSVAANVVFVELPTSVALVEQVRHSASVGVPQGGLLSTCIPSLPAADARSPLNTELGAGMDFCEQAEDRVHRRGQRRPVHVYYMCAHNTTDQQLWRTLGRSLRHVRATMDGEAAAPQHGIHVDEVRALLARQTPSCLQRREPICIWPEAEKPRG